ncbi:hypothetical protein [Lichenifustis flavocetrariae]|uniref:Uncharacterized protein n=1 Tax=Lichenifustis flavocetrariae TaxID=2949735 RepID=A0AA42CQ14_9HYPH|nr:hypothetical protein [Lichenifustis flavocetrariae]MCW6510982.1 hypothetical protein [Lichenifustis flavocetrariae]
MSLLNGGLRAVFGSAFGALYGDGVLHKTTLTDDGIGGVTATAIDSGVKVLVESLSAQDKIGLPRNAVHLTVLRAGLTAGIALDDSVTVDGATYRVVQVDTDPAGAAFALVGVPA